MLYNIATTSKIQVITGRLSMTKRENTSKLLSQCCYYTASATCVEFVKMIMHHPNNNHIEVILLYTKFWCCTNALSYCPEQVMMQTPGIPKI